MKKLITCLAIVGLCTISTLKAQEKGEENNVEIMTEESKEQETFQPVDVSQVPAPIVAAVTSDFKGAKISKAYKNSKDEYKLEIKNDTANTTKTVYASAEGKWIKPSA